jgi:hypothetical protein
MERALYAEDPKFADSLRKTRRQSVDRKRIVFGIVGAIAGLAVLIAGVATSIPLIGLLGFLGMLAGAFVAYTAFVAKPEPTGSVKTGPGSPAAPSSKKRPSARSSSPKPRSPKSGGFMDRLEERWRQRKERGQGL